MVVAHGDLYGFSNAEAGCPIAEEEFSNTESEIHLMLNSGQKYVACGSHDTLDERAGVLGCNSVDPSPMDICQASGPFDWGTVGVPGSPGLSRLFKSLELESATHIPPLRLDEQESDEPACLYSLGIQEIQRGNGKTAGADFHRARSARMRKRFVPPEKRSTKGLPHYPWCDIEFVFCGFTPSPLNEICRWSPSTIRKPYRKPSRSATPTGILEKQEEEFQTKVAKLKSQFQADSPAVLAAIEELALLYCQLGKHRDAESMYRTLVEQYQRTLGPDHIGTLEACQNVVKSLKEQLYYSQAKYLNDDLRRKVHKLVSPDHPLAIRVSKMDAWLAGVLGQTQDCENTRREILQMILTTFGPRHPDTMQALSLLGHTISQTGTEWGGMLLRTAVELSLQDPYQEDFVNCAMMLDLAYSLNFNGAFEESYQAATNAREQFGSVLGPKHMLLIGLDEQRTWSLLEVGKLDESEDLVLELVEIYATRNLGTHNSDVSNAWCGLGNVLAKKGQREEATSWYEKYIHMRISSELGIDTAFIQTAYKLIYCYQEQDRLDDVMDVYHQMMDKFPKDRVRMTSRSILMNQTERGLRTTGT